jgi:hypothetical protein
MPILVYIEQGERDYVRMIESQILSLTGRRILSLIVGKLSIQFYIPDITALPSIFVLSAL